MKIGVALLLLVPLHALGAGRELAPRAYGPSAYVASEPRVAFANGHVRRTSAGFTAAYAHIHPNGTDHTLRARTLELPAHTPPEYWSRYATDVAIAFNGSEGVVAWIEQRELPCHVTCLHFPFAFAMAISRDVTHLDGDVHEFRERATNVAVAASARELVVVTDHQADASSATDLKTRRTIQWSVDEDSAATSDVTWDGAAFVIATRDRHGVLVRRIADVAARTRVASLPRMEYLHAPSIAAAVPGEAIVGVQESDPLDGGRATVHLEREMQPILPTRRRASRP